MVGIVQADGDEFTDVADRATHAGLATHQRQLVGIEPRQFGEFLVTQMRWCDVFNHARQIAQFAVGIDQAGFFAAYCAVTNKFHVCS